jgi:hypothetical protein
MDRVIMDYMKVIYFSLLVLAITMEISNFDTSNFLKKSAILLIILGCLAHFANKSNHLIEIGIMFYFIVEICGSVFHTSYDRRKAEEPPKKRKLLS